MHRLKQLLAAALITWVILIVCDPLLAVEVRHAAPGEYGPLPKAVTDAIFAEHNISTDQRRFFVIVLRVPIFFGGTNARANLILLSLREAEMKRDLEMSMKGAVSRNRMTYDQAAKILRDWTPPSVNGNSAAKRS